MQDTVVLATENMTETTTHQDTTVLGTESTTEMTRTTTAQTSTIEDTTVHVTESTTEMTTTTTPMTTIEDTTVHRAESTTELTTTTTSMTTIEDTTVHGTETTTEMTTTTTAPTTTSQDTTVQRTQTTTQMTRTTTARTTTSQDTAALGNGTTTQMTTTSTARRTTTQAAHNSTTGTGGNASQAPPTPAPTTSGSSGCTQQVTVGTPPDSVTLDCGPHPQLGHSCPVTCPANTVQTGSARLNCTAAGWTSSPTPVVLLAGGCGDFANVYFYEGDSGSGAPAFKSESGMYIYYDLSCDLRNGTRRRWVLDSSAPDLNRGSDLDSDSACSDVAHFITEDRSGPPSGTWAMACGGAWSNESLSFTTAFGPPATQLLEERLWAALSLSFGPNVVASLATQGPRYVCPTSLGEALQYSMYSRTCRPFDSERPAIVVTAASLTTTNVTVEWAASGLHGANLFLRITDQPPNVTDPDTHLGHWFVDLALAASATSQATARLPNGSLPAILFVRVRSGSRLTFGAEDLGQEFGSTLRALVTAGDRWSLDAPFPAAPPTNAPGCSPRPCPGVPQVPGGGDHADCAGAADGDVCPARCAAGYTMQGEIVCSSGEWQVTGACLKSVSVGPGETVVLESGVMLEFVFEGTGGADADWATANQAALAKAAADTLAVPAEQVEVEVEPVDDSTSPARRLSRRSAWLMRLFVMAGGSVHLAAPEVMQTNLLDGFIPALRRTLAAMMGAYLVDLSKLTMTAQGDAIAFSNATFQTPQWLSGPWGACSGSCGQGVSVREVKCSSTNPARCASKAARPENLQECMNRACPYEWTCPGGSNHGPSCSVQRPVVLTALAVGLGLTAALCCRWVRVKLRPVKEGKLNVRDLQLQARFKVVQQAEPGLHKDGPTALQAAAPDGKIHVVWDIQGATLKEVSGKLHPTARLSGGSVDGEQGQPLRNDEDMGLGQEAAGLVDGGAVTLEIPPEEQPATMLRSLSHISGSANRCYKDGAMLEYFSETHSTWLRCQVRALTGVDDEGLDIYEVMVMLGPKGNQPRHGVGLRFLRHALAEGEPVEVFARRPPGGARWHTATIWEQQASFATTVGYRVRFDDNGEVIDKIPSARIRRRFPAGTVVSVLQSLRAGWEDAVVQDRPQKEGPADTASKSEVLVGKDSAGSVPAAPEPMQGGAQASSPAQAAAGASPSGPLPQLLRSLTGAASKDADIAAAGRWEQLPVKWSDGRRGEAESVPSYRVRRSLPSFINANGTVAMV